VAGSVATTTPVREKHCNEDRIKRVLSAQQRRVLRALLDESAMSADPILREEETPNSEEYLTICYELHHVLLPELADMKFIKFDRVEDEVRRGPRFDDVRQFFEQIADGHDW